MSRLARKNRTYSDIGYMTDGGMLDLFDNTVKVAFRLNDDEYDFIAEHATDEDIDVLMVGIPEGGLTFADKRKLITVLNKYLTEYESKIKENRNNDS